jgi:hypothetical protein
MRNFFFAVIVLSCLLFWGCNSDDSQINKAELRKLIIEGLAGDTDANVRLKGLISNKHIGKSDYNQLFIDSLYIGDKHFYSVLLEYFDPSLNLFAIYDGGLNFYLLDKSLNGYLSSEWAEHGNRKFVFVQERFLTKDVLTIDRFSIYEVFDSSASLIYRALSQLVKDNETYNQTVESITPNFILTKINGVNESEKNAVVDTFYFNFDQKKYQSKKNTFENFVKKEIREYNWIITKPEIPSDDLKKNSQP